MFKKYNSLYLITISRLISIIFILFSCNYNAHCQFAEIKINEFNLSFNNKEYDKSLRLGKELLLYAQSNDSILLTAKAYKLIGNVYSRMDSIEKALKNYESGLSCFIKNGIESNIEKCKILYNLSLIYEKKKAYSRAIEYLENSYQGLKNISFPEFQISDWVTSRLYRYLVKSTPKEKLIEILINRKDIFQKFGQIKTTDYADICQSLGSSYLFIDDYYSAISYYKNSSEILTELNKQNLDYAYNEFYLGGIYLQGGNLLLAENKLKISLNVLDSILKVDTTFYENQLFQNLYLGCRDMLAGVYFQLHQYENSLEIFEGLKEYHQNENFNEYLDALISISHCYTNLNEPEIALNTLQSVNVKITDIDSSSASIYLSYLNSIVNLSNYLNKDSLLQNTLQLYKKVVFSFYGEYSKEYIRYIKIVSDLLTNSSRKRKSSESIVKMNIDFIEKSLISGSIKYTHDDSLEVYKCLAKCYQIVDADKALSFYKYIDSFANVSLKPISILGKEDYIIDEIELLFTKKLFYRVYDRLQDYIVIVKEDLSKNSKYLTDTELNDYWPTKLNRLKWALNLLISIRNHVPDAPKLIYEVVLLSKGYLLNSDIDFRDRIYNSRDSISVNRYFMLQNINKTISNYLSSYYDFQTVSDSIFINKLILKSDSLKTLLMRNSDAFYMLNDSLKTDFISIQKKLSDGEALLEYFQYYDRFDNNKYYIAILVSKKYHDPVVIRLCNYDLIKNKIDISFYPKLYNLVWIQIEKYLTGINRIYLSPTSNLNQISFSALSWSDSSKTKYLIDKYDFIQVESSLRFISETFSNQMKKDKKIALFGGMDYNAKINIDTAVYQHTNRSSTTRSAGDFYFSYLPGTKIEVDSISDLVNKYGWHSSEFIGVNATESNFKALFSREYNIVHVATHAFSFDTVSGLDRSNVDVVKTTYQTSSNPLIRSGLLFAGANYSWNRLNKNMFSSKSDDGILTSYELSYYNMSNIDLIILSACGTALGEVTSYEGIFGLKRAIAIARAKSAILSIWPVDDKFTQKFMTLFYQELLMSNNIIEAFFKCQKNMKNYFPNDIRKWASFIFQLN
jgi:CHAT domain-containing protein/tetratricopeptide (TPR) repeat protein